MYPQIPVRAKVRMLPYLLLLAIGLMVADDWGIVDLTAASPTAPTHRPHRRVTTKPAARPSPAARADIPARYLALYRQAGAGARWDGYAAWAVLAGIGKVESDHGRSSAPGVRSGVNRFGCCAGPMQFNLRNGPPSTWDTYGRGNPYDPADAIPAAVRLLVANGARRDLNSALLAYNRSWAYVADVKALARRYQH
jgi:hypothetical protein